MAIGVGIFVPSIPLMASQIRGSLPSDITNLGLWLKADAGITLDTGAVQTWADQSGNGRDFSAPAAGNRPAYSGTLNGLPVLTFDGTTDYLAGNAASLSIAKNVSGLTMIVVAKYASATQQRIVGIATNTAGITRALLGVSTTQWQVGGRRLDADSVVVVGGGASSNNYVIHSGVIRYSVATAGVFINSASQVDTAFLTAGNSSNTDSASVSIGDGVSPSQPLNGDIAEVIIYQRALSTAERASVERYLSVKWGIAI